MAKKPWKLIRMKLHQPPDIRVGKRGVSEGVILETTKLLEKKGIVKVKFLRNIAYDKKTAKKLAEELAIRTGAKIGKVIGKVAILYKDTNDEEV